MTRNQIADMSEAEQLARLAEIVASGMRMSMLFSILVNDEIRKAREAIPTAG